MAGLYGLVWVGFLLVSAAAQAGRLEQIRTNKVLRVCVSPDLAPVSYRHSDGVRWLGLSADLARELARDLGVQLKFVDASFAKEADLVLQNQCDLAISVIGAPVQRGEKLRFTRPHLNSSVCAVVARDNSRIREWADLDRRAVQVVVNKGSLAETMARESLKTASIQALEAGDRVREVESHRADALLTDCQEASTLQEGSPWARQIMPPAWSGLRSVPHAWAMMPDDDRWYARVEYFMSEIRRDGRLRTAARRYGLENLALVD